MSDYTQAEAEAREAVKDAFMEALRAATLGDQAGGYGTRFMESLDALIRAAKAAEHVRDCKASEVDALGLNVADVASYGRKCGNGWECVRLAELTKEAT